MRPLNIYIAFLSSLLILSVDVNSQSVSPSDKNATKETVHLYRSLKHKLSNRFLFGHEDDLAYGVNWRYQKGRSDVKDVTGDYPALYGWELGGIELGHSSNLDAVPFDKMRKFIADGYKRGGVITISWHAGSPFGYEKGAWDTTHGTVASVLPGGINHQLFTTWLDKLATFLGSLKGQKGEAVPVLFRPFHELTGSWFWWGKNECAPAEFKALWKLTFQYLTQEKQLHNLLWVYNTSDNFLSREEFLERYPGDDAVDVISFDAYQYGDPATPDVFVEKVQACLQIITALADEKDKLAALAETGFESIPHRNWWTEVLLKAIGNQKISYVLVWRNHGFQQSTGKMHYYIPFKGDLSAEDFKQFSRLSNTLFERDARKQKLYE